MVELQCHHNHEFDLECVGPWSQLQGTCSICRMGLIKYNPRREGMSDRIKRTQDQVRKPVLEEEEDKDSDMLYG